MRRRSVLRADTKPFMIVVSLNYVWILRKLLKSKKNTHSLKTTIILGTIMGVIIYGSFKVWAIGGFSP